LAGAHGFQIGRGEGKPALHAVEMNVHILHGSAVPPPGAIADCDRSDGPRISHEPRMSVCVRFELRDQRRNSRPIVKHRTAPPVEHSMNGNPVVARTGEHETVGRPRNDVPNGIAADCSDSTMRLDDLWIGHRADGQFVVRSGALRFRDDQTESESRNRPDPHTHEPARARCRRRRGRAGIGGRSRWAGCRGRGRRRGTFAACTRCPACGGSRRAA